MKSSEVISHIVKNYPVLPSKQQLKLVKSWQNDSDKSALDKLVLSNIKAVSKEAFKIKNKNYYISYDDLIQEGIAGLLKAADMFDPKQEVTFLTYAMWWIKANMRRYVMDYRSVVRMGTTRDDRAIFSNLSKAVKEAEELGLVGDQKLCKIAKIIGVNKNSLNQMMITLKGFDARLDSPVKNDTDTLKVDLLEDALSLEDDVICIDEQNYFSNIMCEVIASLPPDEKSIIQERFFSEKPKTLRDLAKDMKISREWVRKLEIKALDRIRKRLASQYDIRSF